MEYGSMREMEKQKVINRRKKGSGREGKENVIE